LKIHEEQYVCSKVGLTLLALIARVAEMDLFYFVDALVRD